MCRYIDGEDDCSLEGPLLGLTMVLELGHTVVLKLTVVFILVTL